MLGIGIATGLVLGWISLFVTRAITLRIKEKKGVRNKDYGNLPFTSKLKDSIRHIIFEYNVKRKNNDFLLDIILNDEIIMQIMHRAHFPELCRAESDIDFGLALYIPVSKLSKPQIAQLDKIIEEDSEVFKSGKLGELKYYLIDLGTRIRFGGYFLHRIIKEVFKGDEHQFSSRLFSEGNLPYWHN